MEAQQYRKWLEAGFPYLQVHVMGLGFRVKG